MSDEVRLRRLDVLFAERVLGYATGRFEVIHLGVASDGWVLMGRPGTGDLPRPLPNYTRSLDAAWEGITKLCDTYCLQGSNGFHDMRVIVPTPPREPLNKVVQGPPAERPAEALVLACLRAVGIGEDEIVCGDRLSEMSPHAFDMGNREP